MAKMVNNGSFEGGRDWDHESHRALFGNRWGSAMKEVGKVMMKMLASLEYQGKDMERYSEGRKGVARL